MTLSSRIFNSGSGRGVRGLDLASTSGAVQSTPMTQNRSQSPRHTRERVHDRWNKKALHQVFITGMRKTSPTAQAAEGITQRHEAVNVRSAPIAVPWHLG